VADGGRHALPLPSRAPARARRDSGQLQEHPPSVDLRLVATNRLCDLAREQIDPAIRYGAGQGRDVEARRLMPELSRRQRRVPAQEPRQDPAELLRTSRIISNALHPDEWTEWCGAHGLQPPRTSNMIELSSAELVVPALLDGVGIGIGRRPIIDPLLKDGRLVPLFRDRAIGKAAYYLVQPPASRNAAARTVAEWLTAEGRATVEGGLRDAAGGADLSGRGKKTKKARGQKS
jgi:LysR family glycine cleavage system transcriptional activator